MDVAYGDAASYNTGPIFESAKLVGRATDAQTARVVVQFRAAGAEGIEVRTADGFEVLTDASSDTWEAAAVVSNTGAGGAVTLACPPSASAPTQVRYLWSQNPCTHPHFSIGNCSVYARAEGLPATPFIGNLTH